MRCRLGRERLPFLDRGLAAGLRVWSETAYCLSSERLAPQLLEQRLGAAERRHGVHEPDVLPGLPFVRRHAQHAAAQAPIDAVAHLSPGKKCEWNAVLREQPALIEQDRWQQAHLDVGEEHVLARRVARVEPKRRAEDRQLRQRGARLLKRRRGYRLFG